jgi:curved DNA-binding protein CbpA
MEKENDPYVLLGIAENASEDEIRKAFKVQIYCTIVPRFTI